VGCDDRQLETCKEQGETRASLALLFSLHGNQSQLSKARSGDQR